MLPIQSVSALQASLQTQLAGMADTSSTGGTEAAFGPSSNVGSGNVFSNLWAAASQQIQATDAKAQRAVTGLLSGQGVEVHDAMIATQQADMTFELALQVRNKAVAAYQQMMSMQF